MNRRLSTTIEDLTIASKAIIEGGLVAVPTETVYGLAADASQETAVESIFLTKGRPSFNPLICHVSGIPMAKRIASVSPLAESLMEKFWPGPLTIVLPKRFDAGLAPNVSAGLQTVGVRCPAGPFGKLIELVDRPVAAPSANRSGKISSTSFQDVVDEFPDDTFPIIDGGRCPVGIESTILKVEDEKIILLRSGIISESDIVQSVGTGWSLPQDPSSIQAPGMTKSHYAPNAKVILNFPPSALDQWDHPELIQLEQNLENGIQKIGILDFQSKLHQSAYNRSVERLELSEEGSLEEVAQRLYSGLRSLDEKGVDVILVPEIPETGAGLAINDRLKRAAADRN